jgi:hypothetical protein
VVHPGGRGIVGLRIVDGVIQLDRRAFLIAALFGALQTPALYAQQARPPVQLGFLRIVAPPKVYVDAFEQGLRDRGYVPRRDVEIEYRFAEGREDELDRLARELVERKVAIVVVAGNQATRVARNATRAIPIVMAVANDPVASGFVASLARPGGYLDNRGRFPSRSPRSDVVQRVIGGGGLGLRCHTLTSEANFSRAGMRSSESASRKSESRFDLTIV